MLDGNGTASESAHPLTSDLIAALKAGNRVLLLGIGSGRHLPGLLAAGLAVDVLEADPARAASASVRWAAASPRVRVALGEYAGGVWPYDFAHDAALATHALLHGSTADTSATLAAVRERLRPGAPFHFTLGSTRDPRFGRGTRLDDATWAPLDGDEAGVAHTYFDERSARELLADWEIVALEQRDASTTVGAWAHGSETAPRVHWFVRARRRRLGGGS